MIVTESFLPQVNGVTNSVLRLLEHLQVEGHHAQVIAPATAGMPTEYAGARVLGLPSVPLPGYAQFPVATSSLARMERILGRFRPDVVHLASPFTLGLRAAQAGRRLGAAVVAVHQTEVPSFAARYGVPQLEPLLWRRVRTIHRLADLTLVPSSFAREQLDGHGIERLRHWGRGVDSTRFHPRRRDPLVRGHLAPDEAILIGYVGRLAAEKQVDDLQVLSGLPGTRLVIIGDGPCRAALQSVLPGAVFLGQLTGEVLPRVLASLDLFVTPGELETFCQTIQEAMASGIPAIAPARGGPVDLINMSRTGWLYPPGDLATMRRHVRDLVGDDAKRHVFGRAARASVEHRTWPAVCAELMLHYREALSLRSERSRAARD